MTGHITKIPRGYKLEKDKLVKTNKHKNIVQKIKERKSKKVKPVRRIT